MLRTSVLPVLMARPEREYASATALIVRWSPSGEELTKAVSSAVRELLPQWQVSWLLIAVG